MRMTSGFLAWSTDPEWVFPPIAKVGSSGGEAGSEGKSRAPFETQSL